jgi:hypothetical protein
VCIPTVFRHTTVQGCVVVGSQDLGRLTVKTGASPVTLQQVSTDVERRGTPPEHTPRLRLKPEAHDSGYVDGAWWPRSDNLAAELPDLLAVLSVRLGRIERVMYNLNEWARPAAKFTTGGRRVKLDGYRRQPTDTVGVLGANHNRIVLLVVPPNTDPDDAHATLMAAAAASNQSTTDGLLTISAREREVRTQAAGAQQRWKSVKARPATR